MMGYYDEFRETLREHAAIITARFGGCKGVMIGSITGKTIDFEHMRVLIRVLEYKDNFSTEEWIGCWIQADSQEKLTEIYRSFEPFAGFKAAVDSLSSRVLDVWKK